MLKAIAVVLGGGGGTPGGTNGQIQYNNAGSFGGFTTSGDATINTALGTLTLATVNGNVGSFGSSTSIPSFTVNAKGLITAASGNAVIAPAGTLTGTTLAANVVSSSLTSVGTLTNLTVTNPIVGSITNIESANEATDTSCFPLFITASGTQTLQPKNNTGLIFNSSTGALGAVTLVSSVSTGTAPLTVASTTKVTNLNADLLDGKDTGTSGNTIPLLDGTNTWSGTQTMGTTTKLQLTDANAFINASSSGNLVVQGSTNTAIGVVGNTDLGDGTLRTFYPNTDNKIDLGDGSHRFNSLYVGQITITDATNIVLSASTGTIIGTSTSQKLGFFNATPIVQVGATIDLGVVLSNLGLRAAGTAYTITTSGAVALTGTVTSNTLALKAGGAAGNTAKSGGVIFDHFADASNGTTVETDLYSDTLAASTFGTNGDKVCAEYAGTFVGDATSTQRLKAYFGGTLIFDSGALGIGVSTVYWALFITCIRESASNVRCAVALNTSFATLNAYATYTKVTGLTLTNTQILKITGTAAGATGGSNQITASEGYVEWKSAA